MVGTISKLEPADRVVVPMNQPTAVAFLDESGAIAKDRFFAVGCLKLEEPARLLRAVQLLRDREHWYQEIHYVALTRDTLPFYRKVVDLLVESDAVFSCFVCDRDAADPVARFGGQFEAYESLAFQLLLGSIRPFEVVTVLADNYSTPAGVTFEESIKARVNQRLQRLAVSKVVRLDSRAADALQLVDLLVSAVAFEFRQSVGAAGLRSPKAQLAGYVRQKYEVATFLNGCKTEALNIKIYRDNQLVPAQGGSASTSADSSA
ncbi:DUF3800 domain-containing protein [Kitasatospora sp. NPDC059648]|uniref:DUF3800 domain-containing protein n=1 Tax=Kitasatospora sp. NPDC059648 TaxID=3346894 RepID=UPI0036A805E8